MTKTYIIDADNCLSVEADLALDPNTDSTDGIFTTQEELATAAKDWPAGRLVEVWNSFAGAPPFEDLKEVRRFKDCKTAVSRISHAAERLGAQVEKDEAARAAKPAPAPKPKLDSETVAGVKAFNAALTNDLLAPKKGKAARKPTAAPTAAKAAPKKAKAPKGTPPPNRCATAARPPRWSPCSSARTAPRWPRSWTRWAG